ncbi:hypothetical protein [Foetidibacter luteolus]|uniref:hypothetical protein n=1 Tax=Foetidibacter luteolus TaxID=2608880 RepID=UPI00129AEA1C|nr:hypothetical protein [Foetidibacter luteolus]
MTKLFTVTFLSLILIACGHKTQLIDKDKKQLDKVCDTFMEFFTKAKTHDAFLLLRKNTVVDLNTIDTLQLTVDNQMKSTFPAFGKMLSYEFITERKIKDFIVKRFYILRFERYYLKFDFTLYKAKGGWTITHFKYEEELFELLD